ncbi:MAG: glycine--tRNA ligase subunit beta [Desulfobulbaceae bacterium]|nr:glycine--tRNA ligase subunit beta [Desulfobulbaceae bacterium]
MAHELLFEIGTEELPAGFIMPALENIKNILTKKLSDFSLKFGEIKTVATPRRLTVSISDLTDRQPDSIEEITGPPKKAAYDADGNPTKAALGFAKSRNASVDDLKVVATPKGEYLMLVSEKKGKETIAILPELLVELIRELPFPKSMRWGTGSTSFARPIQWLLALYGGNVVRFQIENISSGNITKGHRFMAPDPFEVKDFTNYLDKLRKAHVMADISERRNGLMKEINQAARQAEGTILPDDELIEIVTQLVETPHAICGTFEKRFLDLPSNVLITAMREHQKYFAVINENNKLLPNFIAVNNTMVKDAKLGAEGHQRVLRARLEDALFFFREDKKRPLADRVADLSGVIFQAKLGTLLEKTERITKLAGLMAEKLAPDLTETVKRTARLSKSDLLTAMVNEFPTLQGVMGWDYAILDGEKMEVANGILEHYRPIRAGSELPDGIPGTLVSMADRLDSIAGCFGIGQVPTGTTDPYGLRRLSLGLLHIIQDKSFSISLSEFVEKALDLFEDKLTEDKKRTQKNILEFIKARFANDLISEGVPAEAVEAVTSISFDDVVDCRKKIEALMSISSQPAFTLLAGSFKRVMNIIKDHDDTSVDRGLLTETAEQSLYETYLAVADESEPLLEEKKYDQALETILKMKEPVDTFFDDVMVMSEDLRIRNNRLSLLTAISRLFLKIGDFSKMYTITAQ